MKFYRIDNFVDQSRVAITKLSRVNTIIKWPRLVSRNSQKNSRVDWLMDEIVNFRFRWLRPILIGLVRQTGVT